MKENFPNLAKEIDFQEVWEAQRVPKKLYPRRNIPRNIIITLPKVKEKERILKAAREKEIVTYKGVPIRLSAAFSKENSQARIRKNLFLQARISSHFLLFLFFWHPYDSDVGMINVVLEIPKPLLILF